jgi:drug/metabolite transporter (DMT)-like permease
VALALMLGSRPTLVQWVAIVAVVIGVIMVAVSAGSTDTPREYDRRYLRPTIAIALAASLGFALTVAAA